MENSRPTATGGKATPARGRSALVAGASGLVGHQLLSQLLQDPRYGTVKVLTRRALRQPHARLVALERADGAFDQLGAALAADDVYCCLGTRLASDYERVDYQLVVDLARAARSAGARQFIVVSALGASPRSFLPYFRIKARMEAAVSAVDYTAVHIVRPSLLLGARDEAGPGERLVFRLAAIAAPLMRPGLRKYLPIPAGDVAAAMIELARRDLQGVHVHVLPLQ